MANHRPTILHVLHTLRRAGAEVLVKDLTAALRDRYRFVVAALDEGGELEKPLREGGAEVAILDRRPGLDRRCTGRLTDLIESYGVDIVHAHQYTPMCYAAMAGRRGRIRPKLIFTEHGRHYPDRRRLKRIAANRLMFNGRIDRITAVGEFVKRALVSNEAFPPQRVEVIYNGIQPERFERGDLPDAATVRRELNLPANRPVILHVGGLRPVKDHGMAIDALAHLHAQGCPAVLVLVGDGPERQAIFERAEQRGVGKFVKHLGWRGDVERLWRGADVALNCSLSEGVSVALLEAMAAGRAVAATDVGGNGEVVIHGETGLLSPRGNAEALADALRRLLDDAALRRQFGQAGNRRVHAHFHQRDMHRTYQAMYDCLRPPLSAAA